ncbi:DUF420 domain-containing protein [Persicobacter psychrovividus]|uniref:DUF420 domain-containing protein n=1 Tax=Persicobacter psychrovividus TaxID=387638 RepID=A0ABN6L993_9BACT|nr:hypothetical protein PEPS_20710 [Persicobacter psychrovividus]
METAIDQEKGRKFIILIALLSFIIPIAVAVLFFSPFKIEITGEWVKMIPHFNAVINSATAVALVLAVRAIKQKKVEQHKQFMFAAFVLGALFLVGYVIYHGSVEATIFGDANHNGVLDTAEQNSLGILRTLYLGLLLLHIGLAMVVLPLVLLSYLYALSNKLEKHRKIVKLSFPIWLFVSVSGVIVYLMILPYYQ